jgi:tRNA(Arg) A34 adenosine deaminase TadA
MRRAIELSRRGARRGDGGPFGAVVVRDGVIVGEGWNRVIATNDPTAHGEVEAIRDACRRLGTFVLRGCDLFTSAEPCPMCLGAIYWARIDRVFYGNTHADAAELGFDDPVILAELSKPPVERLIPEFRVLADEARQVFREFAANPNRVRY